MDTTSTTSSPLRPIIRRRPTIALLLCLAGLLLGGGVVAAGWAYFHPPVQWQQGVVYGERRGEPLTLDVLTPPKPNGLGVVFMVSGGWKSGRNAIRPWLLTPLLRRGYTVFAVCHISQPQATVDEIVADVSRAVRYIRSHAADHQIDPDRLGVAGGSAGGHLSLMLATRGGPGPADAADAIDAASSAVQAAAVFCPVTDLTDLSGSTEDPGDGGPPKSFRRAFDQEPVDMERWRMEARDLSPLFHVTPGLPPVMICHGDRDTLVTLDQSLKFRDRAVPLGCDVTLRVVEGAGHVWLTMPLDVMRCAAWFDARLRPELRARAAEPRP
ncbi:MAG: alpha/beta hydrolase [Planctomycetaceae bacterium]